MNLFHGAILALLLMLTGQFTIPMRTGATAANAPCIASGAWAMNEGSGLTLNDTSSGGTNTATIDTGASVTWTANAIKSGVTSPVWNASGYALGTSTTLTNFTNTTPFSVSVWINFNGTAEQTFLGTLNATAGTYQGWELQKQPSGAVALFIVNNYPSNALWVNAGVIGSTGTLFYIAATYDGSQTPAGVKIYINGTLQTNSVQLNSLTATSANALPVRFAARNNGTNKLAAKMAYAEVYPCVVSGSQIAANFAAGPGIY